MCGQSLVVEVDPSRLVTSGFVELLQMCDRFMTHGGGKKVNQGAFGQSFMGAIRNYWTNSGINYHYETFYWQRGQGVVASVSSRSVIKHHLLPWYAPVDTCPRVVLSRSYDSNERRRGN